MMLRSTAWRAQNILVWMVLAILAYLVLIPVGMILYGSLQAVGPGREPMWTIGNYISLFTEPGYLKSLQNTLIITLGSTAIAVGGGLLLAWITTRVDLPGTRLIQIGIVIPFLMSPFVGAVAWGYLAAPNFGLLNRLLETTGLGWLELNIYTLGGIAWVSGIYGIPVAYLFMFNAFQGLDYRLEESAEIIGASRWRIMRTIVLPLVLPSILAVALLEFVTAAESYAVPAVLGSPARIDVLSTGIVQDVHSVPANYGRASASSVFLMLVAVIGLLGYQKAVSVQRRFVTVTGKAGRLAPKQGGWAAVLGGTFVVLYLLLAVLLPLAVLVMTSFQNYYGQPLFPLNFTVRNYVAIVNDSRFERAVVNSLIVAVVGSALCVMLGAMVAYITVRSTHPLRNVVDLIATVPVAFPGIVLGLALLWTYLQLPVPIYGTLVILMVVGLTHRLPYANRFVSARLLQLSAELEEASVVTGASPLRTFRKIMMPLAAPSMVSAFLILFIITIREISTVILLYGFGTEMLSVVLLDLWSEGLFVQVAALTVIMLLLMFAVWIVASPFLRSPLQTMK